MLGAIELLAKSASVADAEHTLALALGAWKRGDRRLAISRAITAAVQAGIAGRRPSATEADIERSERVIQRVRNLVQGVVVGEALSGFKKKRGPHPISFRLPRWASDDPEKAAKGVLARSKAAAAVRKEAREKLIAEQDTVLDEIRRTLLTRPTEAPEGKDPLLIPSPEPLALWEELVGVVPRDQLEVSAVGVTVSSPSRFKAVSHLLSAFSEGRSTEYVDPEMMEVIVANFEQAVHDEFKNRLSRVSEAATQEMVRKILGGQR